MQRLIIMAGERILATSGAQAIIKWIETHPKISGALLMALVDKLLDWVFRSLSRGGDLDELRNMLQDRIPSVQWSGSKDTLIKQLRDYASKGIPERAAIMSALADAGVKISIDPQILAALQEGAETPQEQKLIALFDSTASAALVNHPQMKDVRFEDELTRISLLKRVCSNLGCNYDDFVTLRDAILTLDVSDAERAKKLDATNG